MILRDSVLVECIPNFSEGRDARKVARIKDVIAAVAGVRVLDTHADPDHNRSVITFAGPAAKVEEAAVRAAGEAAALIDLNRHRGEHPRFGATDVIPFVPLREATLADCAAIAHRCGEHIWRRDRIPVYFYEAAAVRPERRNLAQIRKGGLEALSEKMGSDPLWRPDVGEPRLHPSAGAVAVGAREALIAFNVNLGTDDLAVAQAIARAVRASGGGLPKVKAMGFLLRSRGSNGQAQVSMNLTDWRQTSVPQAFERVRQEAARRSVGIASSEIVGLTPAGALGGATAADLLLADFGPHKILENRLAELFGTGGQ